MEMECSKCGCSFHATKEDATICPDCLKGEFSTQATRLDDQEHAELVAEYQASIKRQSARAEMMGSMYTSGQAFSIAGKMRLALGFFIFLVCAFVFLVSDKESGLTFIAELDVESQRLFSMILCVVAAVLIATASVRYKKTVRLLSLLVLCAGWFLPNVLEAIMRHKEKLQSDTSAEAVLATTETDKDKIEKLTDGPVLTEDDLQVFYTLRTPSHRISNYAVFIDNQDSRSRSLVRDALNRILMAEYTRAYTRANGALYVVANVPSERVNISGMLSRFGTVTYAAPDKGVYEVRFDADRANLVSRYSSDVLTSPMNNAYVTANLSELKCLDPMRVRMSARSLAASNVKVLRREIHDTLIEVLREPWSSEPDTYASLVEALVTYSGPGDKAAVKVCLEYFESRKSMKRDISSEVTDYLVRECPDLVTPSIIDFWCENSIAWDSTLNQLGHRVQGPLLERLSNTNNLRLITAILKHLQERGTKEALPALTPFLEYSDSIIRHSARTTYKAIEERSK